MKDMFSWMDSENQKELIDTIAKTLQSVQSERGISGYAKIQLDICQVALEKLKQRSEDKLVMEVPTGKFIVEKKGVDMEYPGIYVSYSSNSKTGDPDLLACVELDSCYLEFGEECIKAETYSPEEMEEPTHIENILYRKGEDKK